MNRYGLLVLSRFSSLISLVPLEILILFTLADSSAYYLLGLSITIPIILEFAIQPYFSTLVDRYPRRNIQAMNIFLSLASMLLLVFVAGPVLNEGILLDFLLFIIIQLYYSFTYQVYTALIQDIVREGIYGRFNGIAEITSQLPVLTGAILSGFFLLGSGFSTVFQASIGLQFISLLILSRLNEEFRGNRDRIAGRRNSDYLDSLRYLKDNLKPVLFIFLLNFPFMAVIAGNFLKPVFIATVLNANAPWLAYSESVYALVAMAAGAVVPIIMEKFGYMRSIYLFAIIFFSGSLLMPLIPFAVPFLIFQMLHGLGNPGIRITRNTILMKSVPKNEMGRFNGSMNLLSLAGRLVLLTACMTLVTYLGAAILLFITGTLVVVAITLAGHMLRTSHVLRSYFTFPERRINQPVASVQEALQ